MNTETGQISHLSDDEAPKKGHVLLSPEEYKQLSGLSEETRPEELALLRFVESRAALGARVTVELKNAFRLGFRAARHG